MSTASLSRRAMFKLGATLPFVGALLKPKAGLAGALLQSEPIAAAPAAVAAPKWEWWASSSGERFTVGPCATKEELLEQARDEFFGEPFEITEAMPGEPSLRPDGYSLISLLDELNEEVVDHEGDATIFCHQRELTKEVLKDLERAVGGAIEAWVKRNDITVSVWAFGDQRNQEKIAADLADVAENQRRSEEFARSYAARSRTSA